MMEFINKYFKQSNDKGGILDQTVSLEKRIELAHMVLFRALQETKTPISEWKSRPGQDMLELTKEIFNGTNDKLIKEYGEHGNSLHCAELFETLRNKKPSLFKNKEFLEMLKLYRIKKLEIPN